MVEKGTLRSGEKEGKKMAEGVRSHAIHVMDGGQGHLSDSPAPGHHRQSRTVIQNPCSDHTTSQTSVARRTGSEECPVFNFYFSQIFLNVCRLFIDCSLLQIWHTEF